MLRQEKPAEKSSKTPVINSGAKRVEEGWVTKARADCVWQSRRKAAVSKIVPGGGPRVDSLQVMGKLH
jgi:hypothetical protein